MSRVDFCKSFISGISGATITEAEALFLEQQQPWGVILFSRNIVDRVQLQALISHIKRIFKTPHYPILIDQEGGRVARITTPMARAHPPAANYGLLFEQNQEAGLEAAYLGGRLMADDLMQYGINIDCAPCLDVSRPETAEIIGTRSFSNNPNTVALLAARFMDGLMAGGVLPVIKHIPGHGRGRVDSHLELPEIDIPLAELESSDFVPFQHNKNAPLAMTGHLLFNQIDSQNVSTCSQIVVNQIIRETIGFKGLLMGDDVSMQALSGTINERGEGSLAAGCDLILHCNGVLEEMEMIAHIAPPLTGASKERALHVEQLLKSTATPIENTMEQRWGELLSDIFKPA